MRLRSPFCTFMRGGFGTGRSLLIGIVAFQLGVVSLTRASTVTSSPDLIRQVDHILLTSSRAQDLFTLLTHTFELPVVWPMADYGHFGSGGVSLGNVNLEIVKASPADSEAADCRFAGFALEPEPLQTTLRELALRGIPHGAPAPFRSRELSRFMMKLWTTVALPEVSGESLEVFLCEYTHDVPARRQRFLEQLRSRHGGPLGVQSVREIVCSASDVKRTEDRWQKLLQPVRHSSGEAWSLGAGPAIRFKKANRDEIQEVIVNVSSLEQARRFLKQHDLLGRDGPEAITVRSARLPGFSLTLVESRDEKR